MGENCPDSLEPESKGKTEKLHQSPPEKEPKMKIPQNIIAKCQNSQVKEKIL